MKTSVIVRRLATAALVGMFLLLASASSLAHCDGLDGPVVKAAQRALVTRDPSLILIWVQPEDEPEVRAAFTHALEVRALGAQARQLADRYFFETVVRIHRAGEGAPYTGLKDAGRDLGPVIPAADKAVTDGAVEPLVKLLTAEMEKGLREHFEPVLAARTYRADDVAAGRKYVKAYVEFLHYVEELHAATQSADHALRSEKR